jgi:hypothetical protein
MSAKLVPTFAKRGCHVVSATEPRGRILGFPDRSRYCFFQVAPQLYSRGWVDPVPDPLLLRKSGIARNRNRDLWICSQELWPLDHRGITLCTTPWIHIGAWMYKSMYFLPWHYLEVVSASYPGCFASGEGTPDTDYIGGWVDSRAGLDRVERRKIVPLRWLKLRPLDRSARRL